MEGFETKDYSPNKDILNRRLEDGERVYLSEVYEMLGIERNILIGMLIIYFGKRLTVKQN